ncbi:MAG: hypothetical protein HOK71_04175 [Planctomycetaceae bacterium]|jgi:hypothetical protein|nr:hypothetical protein [Planctomycetaceae bacterium]
MQRDDKESNLNQQPISDSISEEISDDTSDSSSPSYKFYSVWSIITASLFGPLGGGIVLGINYRRLGKKGTGWVVIIGSFLVMWALSLLAAEIDHSSVAVIGGLILAGGVGQALMGSTVERHIRSGGALESAWRAFGIGLLSMVVGLALTVVVITFAPLLQQPSDSDARWQSFRSQDGRFAVILPGKPEFWQTEYESPSFGHMECDHVSSGFGDSPMPKYGVAITDYPRKLTESEIETELAVARSLKETGVRVISTRELDVEGQPAVETASKKGPIYMMQRHIMYDGNRLYSVQIGSTRDPRNNQERVDRFFNSFQMFPPKKSKD